MKENWQSYNFLAQEFGIGDPDSLAALPATVVAEHWLEMRDPRSRLREALRRSHCPATAADSIPAPRFRVVGTMVDGGRACLLHVRDDEPAVDIDELRSSGPRTLFLRRGIDNWWVLPHEDPNNVVGIAVDCPRAVKLK